MAKIVKGKFEVDFGIYGKRIKEGYESKNFFIYKTKTGWTVCHKEANLALSILSNRLLSKAKQNVINVESKLNWDGSTAEEIMNNNNMIGKEFVDAIHIAISS